MTLRAMIPADIPAAAQLWHEGWHDGHADVVPAELTALRTETNFAERLADHLPHTLIAVQGTELLGFVITREDEIYQMYASRRARGTGIAAQLMQAGEAKIRDAGHAKAWLDCAIGNARAARFYEKCGWTNTGETESILDTSEGPFSLVLWRFEKPLTD